MNRIVEYAHLENTVRGHDKFYAIELVQIESHGFVVCARFGRRNMRGNGQAVILAVCGDRGIASRALRSQMDEKEGKGYVETSDPVPSASMLDTMTPKANRDCAAAWAAIQERIKAEGQLVQVQRERRRKDVESVFAGGAAGDITFG